MQLRHDNAKLSRRIVLVEDVIDRDDALVEIQFEDEMIMVLMDDGSFDDLAQEEVEMVTHFWSWFSWFYF